MVASAIDTPKKRIALGVVLALLVAAGIALALAGGGEEAAPPSTTTTTEPTTTTTGPQLPVAPLTGVAGEHLERTKRPALVVKIDNVEPKSRPQAGINEADVVYEERVEGSVTRFLAVFHSTDAAPVGPVRSGRTSDIAIFSALRRPFFAWSGANQTFAQRIRASNMVDVGYDAATDQYFRDGGRPGTHNLMIRSTDHIMRLPAEGSGPPPALFTFRPPDQKTPAHHQPVGGVRVTYGSSAGSAPVEYRWDGKGWARTQKGTPHVDAAGVQVAPPNVIVQFTGYLPSDVGDQFGNPIPEAQLVGDGPAWIFTAGGVVEGHWHKPTLDAVTSYVDADGNPIGLTPGRTWIALASPGDVSLL